MLPRAERIKGQFEVHPLSAVLGAEIIGVDVAQPLTDALFDAIAEALHRYHVLVFPGQHLDTDQQVAFSRRFGTLQVHVLNQYRAADRPEVIMITNLDKNGKPQGFHPDPGAQIWHSDGSWNKRPGKVTMLYGIEVPAQGGNTDFANMEAAYDALSEADKVYYATLRAVHDLNYSRSLTTAKDQMTEEQKAAAPPVERALIKTHPATGRKSIYLGGHASHIVGMPLAEGRQLVAKINAHATQPQFTLSYRWRPHDLVLWDNRAVLHRATAYDYGNARRVIRRTTVLDDNAA
ncbi:MAG: TauD/TfdA family dioxygenase [Gammaproteobacteria bacterium]